MAPGRKAGGKAAALLLPLLGTGLALPVLGALAASAKPAAKPPAAGATYAIEAITTSGMGAMALGGANMMQMMMGGQPSLEAVTRQLELRLQSPQASSSPTAEHRIPAALAMGTALPLQSGSDGPPGQPPRWNEEEIAEGKGRLLLFRGCGESSAAGQPEIIPLQGLRPEQRRQAMQGLKRMATLPSPAGSPGTTGRWPEGSDAPAVPLQGSLVGTHEVVSNYAPAIRFQVDAGHDFLAPVKLQSTASGGAQRLSWQTIPTALGYQATAVGMGRQGGDIVMWTSSEAPWGESSVPNALRAAEAARLVQRQVLLPPERTTCSVSAQAMAAMQTAMLTFTAYGDTLILSSPKGSPAWRLSLERRATALRPLGEGLEMVDPGAGANSEEPPRKERGFNPFRLF